MTDLLPARIRSLPTAVLGAKGGLGQRMARGSMWVMIGNVTQQLTSLASLAILARFLSPNDFGLMAVVLLVLGALDTFTTPGFTQALIQRAGDIERFFSSVFVVNLLRGVGLALVTLVVGPTVAKFFGKPDAASVVQFAGVIFILRSLQSPALAKIDRQLDYRRYFFLNMASALISLIVAVVLAPILHNVWVLLISSMMKELSRTFGSYAVAPWKPSFSVKMSDVIELNRFGRWVVAGSVVAFLSLQLDNVVVGRVLGTTALGFYEIAFRISQLPATQISQVAATVAFPALSSVAMQPERFQRVYLKMTSYLYAVNFLAAVGLLLLAEPIVHYGLGSQWETAVPALRILAVAGFVRSLVSVGGRVFYAAGHPKYDFAMNILRLVVFAAIVYPMAAIWRLEGVAIAVLLAILCVVPIYLWLIQSLIGIRPRAHITGVLDEYSRITTRLPREAA